jgi:hypothetical protein
MRKAVVLMLSMVFGLSALGFASQVPWSNVRDPDATVGLREYAQCVEGDSIECPAGALQEGEPICHDGYADAYNGGCNSYPEMFTVLKPSCHMITLCGTSGVYDNYETRDTDWFQIALVGQTDLTFCCTAEFPLQLLVIDGNTGCPVAGEDVLAAATAAPCEQACIQITLQAGTYWLWVGPSDWVAVPCGSAYVMTVALGCSIDPLSLDFGSVAVGSYQDMDFTITNTCGEPLSGSVSEVCVPYSVVSGGGNYTLAPGDSMTVTVRFAPTLIGPQPCQIAAGIDCPAVECTGTGVPIYCSFPCWTWAAGCLRGLNQDASTLPACIRDSHFDDAFPNGLVVGVSGPGRHKATWTSAAAIQAFTCGYGLPAVLGRDYVDPGNGHLASIFGEVMALRLNREFSCKGYFTDRSMCYGTAVVPPQVPRFAGLTVDQLLDVADQALSGKASALVPYGNSLMRLQSAVAYMNQLHGDCGRLVAPPPIQQLIGDEDLPDATAKPLPSRVSVTSHPNPLQTSVTISLALPAAGNVSLEIYDVQGRRVVTMASQPMGEGYHDVTWNGADDSGVQVVSGLYFLRVQVDGRAAVVHKLTKL